MSRNSLARLVAFLFGAIGLCRAGTISSVWVGGTGNWSNTSQWTIGGEISAGLPLPVKIGSGGNDVVYADMSVTLNSLTLGGSTGGGSLKSFTGNNQILTTGNVTVTGTGVLNLNQGDSLVVGADLTNAGQVHTYGPGTDINVSGNVLNSGYWVVGSEGASLTVAGDLNNSGALNVGTRNLGNSTLNVAGRFANTGIVYMNEGTTQELDTIENRSYLYAAGAMNVRLLDNVRQTDITGEVCANSFANWGVITVAGNGALNGPGCSNLSDPTMLEIISSERNYGVLNGWSTVNLSGLLDVRLADGYIPSAGQSFQFVNFTPGTSIGVFSGLRNEFFNNNTQRWVVTYDNGAGQVLLTATAVEPASTPEPASAFLFLSGLSAVVLAAERGRHLLLYRRKSSETIVGKSKKL